MAKQKTTAIAKSDDTAAAIMAPGAEMPDNWLGDILGDEDLGVTGTEEMGQEDIRLPSWLLNSKKEDKATGRECPSDVFWNTVTEEGKEVLRLQILSVHKSRLWKEEGEGGRLEVKCASWDGVTGQMSDDSTRPCAGCPDYKWRTHEGRRVRNCTDVYNLLARDRETQEIGVLKVKKTALKPWKEYFQRYFYRKRQVQRGGKTVVVDNPLFAAETLVEAEKRTGGQYTWYVPKFTFQGLIPRPEIIDAAEFLKATLDEYLDRAAKTHDTDDADEPTAGETEIIDSADFADDGGTGSTSSSGAKAAGADANRF